MSRELHNGVLKTLGPGRFSSIVPMVSSTLTDSVADSPSKSYVTDQRGRRAGVLIVSNSVNRDLVARSVAKAREAKQALGDELGVVVLEPIVDGVFSGLSFALWPLQRDLSSSRVIRHLEKRLVRRRALRWLEAATRQTICPDIESKLTESMYSAPLARVSGETRCSAGVRDAAMQGLHRLASGTLRPVAVLQHSDLWLGNFLLPLRRNGRSRNTHGFYIIDWAGATLSGHPFIDLLRFGESSGMSPRRLRSEIETHCEIVGCELVDAICYSAAALGVIGMNLEHFPEPRYLQMCERVVDTVSAAVSCQGAAIHRGSK